MSQTAHELLVSLVGREIRTMNGRPNKLLRLERGRVLVATDRSPQGKWVEIEAVQKAMDTVNRDEEIAVSVPTLGCRSAFVGAVLLTIPDLEPRMNPSRIARRRR